MVIVAHVVIYATISYLISQSDEESVEETPRKATPKERTSVSQGLKITIPGKKRKAVVTSSSSSDDVRIPI